MSHLFMRRPDLNDLPTMPALAAGYTLRTYQEGDLASLAILMRLAFSDEQWTPERLRRILIDAPDVKTVFVVEHAGHIVASASARVLPDQYPGSGYVHWVGVAPLHRGQHLGTVVTLATLYAFRDLGCRDAVLETEDQRLAAIKTYQNLGFVPEDRHSSHPQRWVAVLANLSASANI